MQKISLQIIFILFSLFIYAQKAENVTSSEILLNIKKLNVLGSVLYIAAHPDDENTKLLAYLANEKLYRTAYLSLTRGDGGQNLIGDEQGVDLGLIRTQELLASRRIDGAEQYFSTAYDFGFSKTPLESLTIWDENKILDNMVWIIRKFKPDVIITRFPTTGEGGHGQHTASAILTQQAFEQAADSTKFKNQFKYGVSTWQAKRLLWNTFNFGTINTQAENQFKINVGGYNPLLGKSYGEIAAESRSQNKTQGFGVATERGDTLEYFKTILGNAPVTDLFDGIDATWQRISKLNIEKQIYKLIKQYDILKPEKSIEGLVNLYKKVEFLPNENWRNQKLIEIKKIIEHCAGLYLEASTKVPFVAQGDSLIVNFVVNSRIGSNILSADVKIDSTYIIFDQIQKNKNSFKEYSFLVKQTTPITQPYFLINQKEKGSYVVTDQNLIGMPENTPYSVDFSMMIAGKEFVFTKPIQYKYVDAIKGEITEPLSIVSPMSVSVLPSLLLLNSNTDDDKKSVQIIAKANKNFKENNFYCQIDSNKIFKNSNQNILAKEEKIIFNTTLNNKKLLPNSIENINAIIRDSREQYYYNLRKIKYDHIPIIRYEYVAPTKVLNVELKIAGKNIAYISGSRDKVPQALEQMGYTVFQLNETDLMDTISLQKYDAIITGIRAYNTNTWLDKYYTILMQYIYKGGVLINQYNTNNTLSSIKMPIGPYPFTIGQSRVTNEDANVHFLKPNDEALHYPNEIIQTDFLNWVQERSTYQAENTDSHYRSIIGMNDAGENEQDGSLILCNYGKGKYVYTGITFFRQLPAAVPGAFRLLANLLAKPKN